MATLLLRLAAPLQAWGTDSQYETRRTAGEPTKSGIIGLLAAALGRSRDSDLGDLNTLRFGVRVDQPGELLRDFHTAHTEKGVGYVTNRWYLEDAVFLVGLEHEDGAFLETLREALLAPAFPLFLGRRSCPPTLPLVLGIRDTDLESALRGESWLADEARQNRLPKSLRILIDDPSGSGVQRDLPVSFSPLYRSHSWRRFRQEQVPAPGGEEQDHTTHDPMSELR